MPNWIDAGPKDAVEVEDVMRFDHEGRTFAIYRDESGAFFASDGLCTHEQVHLADGFVVGSTIECPRHQGRFDIRTGKAKGAPVCIDLKTYPVRIEAGRLLLGMD